MQLSSKLSHILVKTCNHSCNRTFVQALLNRVQGEVDVQFFGKFIHDSDQQLLVMSGIITSFECANYDLIDM